LERGDSGIRSLVYPAERAGDVPIYAFGSEEQKNKMAAAAAAGKKIGCFGVDRSRNGSNPGGRHVDPRGV